MASPRHAGVEAGGTKFRCAVASDGKLLAECTVATGDPEDTLREVAAFFDACRVTHGGVDAVGVASFGPLQLDPASPRYGEIIGSPKHAWNGVNLVRHCRMILDAPVVLDTDVNAAAAFELENCPAARRLAYVTVGTGVGVGLSTRGAESSAAVHLEGGHVPIARHPALGTAAGTCPFHGACVEGVASGTAINTLWGKPLDRLPDAHCAFDVVADAIGQLCASIHYLIAPDRIVLGGGVLSDERMLPRIRAGFAVRIAGYHGPRDPLFEFLRAPSAPDPGLHGALLIARRAVR